MEKSLLTKLTWMLLAIACLISTCDAAATSATAGGNNTNATDTHAVHPPHGHATYTSFAVFALLALGGVLSELSRGTIFPYTVVLLCVGMGLGAPAVVFPDSTYVKFISDLASFDPHLMLHVFLPVLLYESAYNIDYHIFKRQLLSILILAGPGVLLATTITGVWMNFTMHSDYGFGLWEYLLMGSILSATDPVAVVALLKELGASVKLATIIEGESLFNDGTAYVVYLILVDVVIKGIVYTPGGLLWKFCFIAFGGPLLGWAFGKLTVMCIQSIVNNDLVEISIMFIAPYIAFHVCEFVGVSGVLAVVVMGIYVNVVGRTVLNVELEHFLHEFYEMLAFLANTLLFLLVGIISIVQMPMDLFKTQDFFYLLLVYVGIHISRATTTIVMAPILSRLGYGLPWKEAVVMVYGGLRGGVGLALALMLRFEYYEEPQKGNYCLFFIAGIVFLTLAVNGTTTGPLLRSLGMATPPPAKAAMIRKCIIHLREETQKKIAQMQLDPILKDADWTKVHSLVYFPLIPEAARNATEDSASMKLANEKLAHGDKSVEPAFEKAKIVAYSRVLKAEKDDYWHQFKEGLLGRNAVRSLMLIVDANLDTCDGVTAIEDIAHLLVVSKRLNKAYTWFIDWPLLGSYLRNQIFRELFMAFDVGYGYIRAQKHVQASLALAVNSKNDRYYGPKWQIVRSTFLKKAKIAKNLADLKKGIAASVWKTSASTTKKLSLVPDKEIAILMYQESKDNVMIMEDHLETLRQAYPDIAVAIRSILAANNVLQIENHILKGLSKQGAIDASENAKHRDGLRQKQYKLGVVSSAVEQMDIYDMVADLDWVKLGGDTGRDLPYDIFSTLTETTIHENDSVWKDGDKPLDGIYLITRGLAKIVKQGRTIETLGPGSVLGEYSFLTTQCQPVSVRAETYLYLTKLDTPFLTKLFFFDPQIHAALWLQAMKKMSMRLTKLDLLLDFPLPTEEPELLVEEDESTNNAGDADADAGASEAAMKRRPTLTRQKTALKLRDSKVVPIDDEHDELELPVPKDIFKHWVETGTYRQITMGTTCTVKAGHCVVILNGDVDVRIPESLTKVITKYRKEKMNNAEFQRTKYRRYRESFSELPDNRLTIANEYTLTHDVAGSCVKWTPDTQMEELNLSTVVMPGGTDKTVEEKPSHIYSEYNVEESAESEPLIKEADVKGHGLLLGPCMFMAKSFYTNFAEFPTTPLDFDVEQFQTQLTSRQKKLRERRQSVSIGMPDRLRPSPTEAREKISAANAKLVEDLDTDGMA